ncbi:bifunctional hydroxymethylpyrimidine kinase/phosphomethylpyrimidine kinase, partial [Pyramidobacter sp. C12-8]|uniref:bifunctional hydroxymethylpyrimidine kinase/phosphomethylpyrimidine kinase n=1 Tax=Pyramidobacter sp. C12-8 TaxID=1943580 RepID=UPI001980C01B
LPTVDIIKLAGELLAKSNIPHVVIDPVMVCKGAGQPLFPENTKAMIDYLLPLAEVLTPNTFEAEQLAGM